MKKVRLLIDSSVYDCLSECQPTIKKMEKLWLNGIFDSLSLNQNNPLLFEEDEELRISYDDEGILNFIRIEGRNKKSKTIWMEIQPKYSPRYIETFGKRIFGDVPNQRQLGVINLLFLYLELHMHWYTCNQAASFLVTNNRYLLKMKEFFRSFLKTEMEILNVQDTYIRLDLLSKKHNIYISDNSIARVDKGTCYHQNFISKIPNFRMPKQELTFSHKKNILESFASRFVLLLICIDELAFQYYYPKDSEIMIPTVSFQLLLGISSWHI